MSSFAAPAPVPAPTPATARAVDASWRALAVAGLVAVAVADVVVVVLARQVIPPLIAFAVLGLVAAALLERGAKAGPIVTIVVAALSLLLSVPFAGAALAHPESPVDFVHAVAGTAGRVLVIAAGLGVLRAWSHDAARRAGLVALGLSALVVVAAVGASLATTSDAAGAGDVRLGAEAGAWGPAQLTVASGASVFVDNRDAFRHTFAVDGTDVLVEVPAWASRQVTLDLAPGAYAFRCTVPGHESMTGKVQVDEATRAAQR